MYRLAATLVAIAASASIASAATETRYVSTLGNDSMNTCLVPAAPCRTITQAVSLSDSTDTVYVAGGKYTESISLTDNGSLTISGSWNEAFTDTSSETPTVLSSKGARPFTLTYVDTVGAFTLIGVNISKSSPELGSEGGALFAEVFGATASLYLVLQDLEIVGNKAARVGGVSVTNWQDATAYVGIYNVRFAGNSATGDCGALKIAGQLAPPPDFLIVGSEFEKNKTKNSGGAACFQGYDQSTDTVPSQIIAGSTFVKNKAYSAGAIYAPTFAGRQNLYVENSTFLQNKASTHGGAIFVHSTSPTAINECVGELTTMGNTLSGNKAKYSSALLVAANQQGSTVETQALATSMNDIIYGNKSQSGTEVAVDAVPGSTATLTREHGIYGQSRELRDGNIVDGPGVLSTDPLFVKAGTDIHLTDASPAIDAGNCATAPPYDFEGDARPNGAGCDIGADEH